MIKVMINQWTHGNVDVNNIEGKNDNNTSDTDESDDPDLILDGDKQTGFPLSKFVPSIQLIKTKIVPPFDFFAEDTSIHR